MRLPAGRHDTARVKSKCKSYGASARAPFIIRVLRAEITGADATTLHDTYKALQMGESIFPLDILKHLEQASNLTFLRSTAHLNLPNKENHFNCIFIHVNG